jgi:hypothetical protein
MSKTRRKPRYCRQCGTALRTSKTGRWFFCGEECQAEYVEEHEPDVDAAFLLDMEPLELVEGEEPPVPTGEK